MKPLLLATLLAAAGMNAQAAEHAHHGLAVQDAWSRPAAAGTTGAGFLILRNAGPADVLVSAESPLAERVEMHRSSMAGGVMSMAKVDRLAAPRGATLRFEPGALHLMLIGLKSALKPGEKAPVTLRFASGARVTAELVVRGPGETMQMAH